MKSIRLYNALGRIFPQDISRFELLLFIGSSSILLITLIVSLTLNLPWLMLLPVLAVLLFVLLYDSRIIFYLIVILVPFSAEMQIPMFGSALQVPTEPLIIMLLAFWVVQSIYINNKEKIELKSTQRVNYVIYLFLSVLAISIVTSSLPVVSAKYFANTLWYVTVCYFFVKSNFRSIYSVKVLISIFFLLSDLVVIYTLIRHAATGFSSYTSNEVVQPFFSEHGTYAAYLSIIFGIAVGISFSLERRFLRLFARLTSIILFVGIIFSYTRAAWLGIAVMLLFLIVIKSKDLLRFKTFISISIVAGLVTIFIVYFGVQSSLERNVQSITDVEKNLSNLERVDRWMAAINMIKAYPIVGVGYGTYPFHFKKYQDHRFDTPISNFFGFPHNDYLQLFSETGIFGISFWLLLFLIYYRTGIKCYFTIRDNVKQNILLGSLGGIITYLVHAFFNGYLQYDKVAIPFWVTLAIGIICIELSRNDFDPLKS